MTFPRLFAIVDADAAARAGWTAIDVAQACLDGGARLLQVRAKSWPGAPFLDTAAAIVARARDAGATVVVNDRADIARLSEADGVHVGQDDLAPREVRPIVGDRALIGFSTHTGAQLEAADREPVDYLAIGPVFGTRTKVTGYEPVGLAMVGAAAARAARRRVPLVAIGGITLETALQAIEAGAASVAVIGDLLSTGDPGRRVRDYLRVLG